MTSFGIPPDSQSQTAPDFPPDLPKDSDAGEEEKIKDMLNDLGADLD